MGAATTDYLVEQEEPTGGPENLGQLVRSESLERIERRNRILKLRRDGLTADQISSVLARGEDGKDPFEITPKGVASAVSRYIASLRSEDEETIEELRFIDRERLERMFSRLEIDYLTTPTKDTVTRQRILASQLKVLERKAKLDGLDAPTKVEGNFNVNLGGVADPEHVRRVEGEFAKRHGGAAFQLPGGPVIDAEPDSVRDVTDGEQD